MIYTQLKMKLAGLMLVFSLSLNADMPSNNYACHVLTESTKVGVIFIQAPDVEVAIQEAFGRMAYISKDAKEKTITVLQCINHPGNKFNDIGAQKLLESIPQ